MWKYRKLFSYCACVGFLLISCRKQSKGYASLSNVPHLQSIITIAQGYEPLDPDYLFLVQSGRESIYTYIDANGRFYSGKTIGLGDFLLSEEIADYSSLDKSVVKFLRGDSLVAEHLSNQVQVRFYRNGDWIKRINFHLNSNHKPISLTETYHIGQKSIAALQATYEWQGDQVEKCTIKHLTTGKTNTISYKYSHLSNWQTIQSNLMSFIFAGAYQDKGFSLLKPLIMLGLIKVDLPDGVEDQETISSYSVDMPKSSLDKQPLKLSIRIKNKNDDASTFIRVYALAKGS